jgi:hypothetical protein
MSLTKSATLAGAPSQISSELQFTQALAAQCRYMCHLITSTKTISEQAKLEKTKLSNFLYER